MHWGATYSRYRRLYRPLSRACAALYVWASRGLSAQLGLQICAFTCHEAPAINTSTQILPRRRAAPVRDVAPSNTKASRPSRRLRGSRRLVKVVAGVLVQGVVHA